MAETYLPTREADLLAFALNFNTRLVGGGPAPYGIPAPSVTGYTALFDAFQTAYNTANQNQTRTPGTIAAKNTAKEALIDGTNGIRELVNIIQANPATTDQQRQDLQITVPDVEPTPVPIPGAPNLSIESVAGRIVSIHIQDADDTENRGRPFGVIGATVLTYIGEEAPSNPNQWSFYTNTGRTTLDVDFPAETPAGSQVWITAFWFNSRKESGPPAAMQTANISVGLAQAA